MSLDWKCLLPTSYTGRKCRFAVTFTSWNGIININPDLQKYFLFSKNDSARRVSFMLPEGSVQRCQFSTKLITEHASAERFLNDFIKANPQIPKTEIRYIVFDDNGMDLPFVPDLTSQSAKRAVFDFASYALPIGLIALAVYFKKPIQKMIRKGKR